MSYAEDFDVPVASNDGGHQAVPSASIDDQYFDAYGDMAVHRLMLQDGPRMEFYHAALSSSSISGRVVVDVGAGTGVLSLWAVLHGDARHCFSFEASPLATVLEKLARANGAGADRMTVIPRRVEDVIAEGAAAFVSAHPWLQEAGGVDIVVSEWMGFYLVHECMLPSVVAARDFFRSVNDLIAAGHHAASATRPAKPVRMIPDNARIIAAPVNLDDLRRKSFEDIYSSAVNAPLSSSPSSRGKRAIDFSLLGQMEYESKMSAAVNPLIDIIPASCCLAEPQVVLTWDLETVSLKETLQLSGMCGRFEFGAASSPPRGLHGFALWFDVGVSSRDEQLSLTLTTSPFAPPTHWKQCVLMLDPEDGWRANDIHVPAGTVMMATFAAVCEELSTRQYTLSFELGEEDYE